MHFDDIFLTGTDKENLNSLTKVLWHMKERNIKLNFSKSQLMMDVVENPGTLSMHKDCMPLWARLKQSSKLLCQASSRTFRVFLAWSIIRGNLFQTSLRFCTPFINRWQAEQHGAGMLSRRQRSKKRINFCVRLIFGTLWSKAAHNPYLWRLPTCAHRDAQNVERAIAFAYI